MNKRMIFALVMGVALMSGLVASGCAAPPPTPEEELETVKIGFIGAFSGPAAMWFVPGITGLTIWEDEINAAGGIEVGGNKYLVEVVYYDDEFIPSKTIAGVKKLVLEDGVKMLIMCCGAPVAAIQPFVNEEEVLILSQVMYESSPDRPWVLGVGECAPFYSAIGMQYAVDTYPEIKRVAVLGQDEEINLIHTAWTLAGAEAAGLEVVYEKMFAIDTIDFAPIVSAVMATEPDLVSMPAAWPEFRTLLVEQFYLQGYKGKFESSECEVTAIYEKVPAGYIEGFITYRPGYLTDLSLPQRSRDYFKKWLASYGPGAPEDIGREPMPIDHQYANEAWVWEYGVKLADSFEPRAVRDALLAAKEVPTQYGMGIWWGEEIVGVNYLLAHPTGIIQIEGTKYVAKTYLDHRDWFNEGNNAEIALKHLEEKGLLWWQE